MSILTKLFKPNTKTIDINKTALNFTKINKFRFYKVEINSISSLLKGIQFKDIEVQKKVFLDKPVMASVPNWQESRTVYFLDREIDRDSEVYTNFLEEVFQAYIMNNPIMIKEIMSTDGKMLTFDDGGDSPEDSLLTKEEALSIINQLRDMLKAPI